eukprot:2057-Chlamydomonas_euryale.AAC.2
MPPQHRLSRPAAPVHRGFGRGAGGELHTPQPQPQRQLPGRGRRARHGGGARRQHLGARGAPKGQ